MSESYLMESHSDAIADRAIASMRSPKDMPIICVDVTNRCDLRCSNCTRLLVNQEHHWDMTPDNFRVALRSLRGFEGVIAMIGGNPCLNKYFKELCVIFAEEIPVKRQRGLWSNNVFEYQELIRDTCGFFNLNPHNDDRCMDSLAKLKKFIPGISYYEGHSSHAPLLTAVRDVIPDEQQMWHAIAGCDINKNWSASIVQNNGELRAYFCEVAASFDLARHGDHGVPVTEGWWRRSITDYADQVKRFCPGCGGPARLKGHFDKDETDDSEQHGAPPPTAPSQTGTTVSVIISYYNDSDTISESIESVIIQRKIRVIDVDIIVADDVSTDDSLKKVSGLPVKYPGTIRYATSTVNAGPATARNRGLKHANGDLVCFLDSDDCYAPGFFETAIAAFDQDATLAAVFTGVELINNHSEIHPIQHNAIVSSIPSNVMVRRGIAELLGGFPEDRVFRGRAAGEDVVFRHLLSGNFKVRYLDKNYLRYRVKRGSHFDEIIDSSEIVDGSLRMTRLVAEDANGMRPAAGALHRRKFNERVQLLERCRIERPFETRGLEMVQHYESVRARIGGSDGIAGPAGYYLYRCAIMTPGRGYIGGPRRLSALARMWLDEGSRSVERLPTAALEDIFVSEQPVRLRMLVLDMGPGDQQWIAEFRSAIPFLHERAFLAVLGVPDGGIPSELGAVLRASGTSWSVVGRVGVFGTP